MGGVHGLGQIIESILPHRKETRLFTRILKTIVVFCFVGFAWVFFRTQNFSEAIHVFTHLFTGIDNPIRYLYKGYRDIYMPQSLIIRCAIMLVILAGHDGYSISHDAQATIQRLPAPVRWALYLLVIWLIIAFMPIGADQEFIYFQF